MTISLPFEFTSRAQQFPGRFLIILGHLRPFVCRFLTRFFIISDSSRPFPDSLSSTSDYILAIVTTLSRQFPDQANQGHQTQTTGPTQQTTLKSPSQSYNPTTKSNSRSTPTSTKKATTERNPTDTHTNQGRHTGTHTTQTTHKTNKKVIDKQHTPNSHSSQHHSDIV